MSVRPGLWRSNFNPRSREGSDLLEGVILAVMPISIHAPVKGATGTAAGSRAEHGISIHAPVKGATYVSRIRARMAIHFNPRSREGSDQHLLRQEHVVDISIHAPVKGATFAYVKRLSDTSNFNPRSREGSDMCP